MKNFIFKTLVYCIGLLSLYGIIYLVYSIYFVLNPTDSKSIYVWGDSQTYQGLILDSLEKILETKCYSSAKHGNGVYDFLVFTEAVPEKSVCVVGMSEALLYRQISSDNNHSGLNIKSINTLYKCGYSIKELCKIAQTNNFLPQKRLFSSKHSTYSYADTIFYAEPLDGWKKLFDNDDEYHEYKKKAYLHGLQRLAEKSCTIHIITYPLYEEIESYARTSSNRKKTLAYQDSVIKRFMLFSDVETIYSDSLLMHDLSHLNEVGARLTTNSVVKHLINHKDNSFLEIKITP